MSSNIARVIGICFAGFVAMPLLTTSSCASSDENDGVFSGGTGGKDAGKDQNATGGTGGGGTGGGGTGGGGTGGGGTGGTGGTVDAGCPIINQCPTPQPPAKKCCVNNTTCGIDYGAGAGCQKPSGDGGV